MIIPAKGHSIYTSFPLYHGTHENDKDQILIGEAKIVKKTDTWLLLGIEIDPEKIKNLGIGFTMREEDPSKGLFETRIVSMFLQKEEKADGRFDKEVSPDDRAVPG